MKYFCPKHPDVRSFTKHDCKHCGTTLILADGQERLDAFFGVST